MTRRKQGKNKRGTPGQGTRSRVSEGRVRSIPAWRSWLYRLVLIVAAPLVVFGLSELTLHLVGYGFPTSFFVQGDDTIRTNPEFSKVYFPAAVARTPISRRLPEPKQEGSYRIFVLGGSAAQGFPKPAFSVGRVLDAMLREGYPDVRFEVVNAAVTAVNSHVVLPIARNCARRGADLFVVYAGNNEIVGPYGPGTEFLEYSPSLPVIRASLAVKRSRTGQLLGSLLSRSDPPMAGWAGMETFTNKRVAVDDPRLESVYRNLGSNLGDIIDSARERDIPVIVSNVAVNLRDSAPFSSLHRADLSAGELERWQALYDEGVALQTAGKQAEAAERYRGAAQIDDRHAELQFRLAQCLSDLGDAPSATAAFERARELDALRFRADAGINETIRAVAAGREAEGVRFVDAQAVFAGSVWTDDGVPGESLFVDHVHMTVEGNYLLASAVFEELERVLPSRIREKKTGSAVPSLKSCVRRIAYTEWDRLVDWQKTLELMERPPFTAQFDNSVHRAALERRARILLGRMSLSRLAALARIYGEAIEDAPEDPWLRVGISKLLVRMGDAARAEPQLREALAIDPTHRDVLWQMSKVLAEQGKFDEAARDLERILEIDPDDMEAATRYPVYLVSAGRVAEAVTAYRELTRKLPANASIRSGLARVLAGQGKFEEAEAEYRQALRSDPSFSRAGSDLVKLLASRGDSAGARAVCQEMIQAGPGDATPHLILAAMSEQTGDLEQAARSYESAVASDPDSIEARRAYGMFLARQGSVDEAGAYYRRMLAERPDLPGAHFLLSFALSEQGRLVEAAAELRKELGREPNLKPAVSALARILATANDPQLRNGREALALAEHLVVLAPDDSESFHTLAAAYASLGRFDLAVVGEQKAVDLAQLEGGPSEAKRVEQYNGWLKRYEEFQAKQPSGRSAAP